MPEQWTCNHPSMPFKTCTARKNYDNIEQYMYIYSAGKTSTRSPRSSEVAGC